MSECTHHIVITSLLQPLQDGGAHEPGPGDGGGVLSDLLVGEGGHQAVSHPGVLRPAMIMFFKYLVLSASTALAQYRKLAPNIGRGARTFIAI